MHRAGIVRPIFIIFENDILNGAQGLIGKISAALGLNAEQQERLIQCSQNPDKDAIRFNKGIQGRGKQLISPGDLNRMFNMAIPYLDELSDNELELLFGADREAIANSRVAS